MKRYHLLAGLLLAMICACSPDLPPVESFSDQIRINQLGYYPMANKKAVIVDSSATEFYLVSNTDFKVVYESYLSEARDWKLAGERVRVADFSEYERSGEFLLYVPGVGYSYPFEIKNGLYDAALSGTVRALYYQRAGMEITEEYGGMWHRKSGHPDQRVAYHPSSGKTGFNSSPKGWYDAGDFGKYVVNGAYPLGQLLHLAERYPSLLPDETLNIPESGNGQSDLLDELKYEMDWLLTMQDEDGGLFFKLTTERFEGMIMPAEGQQQRFIIGKGTAPSLDFTATAAKAYRVFINYDNEYATQCLKTSKAAWQWAKKNPDVAYSNPEGIVTGEYGDADISQEFYWAAAELYISTGEAEYLNYLNENPISFDFTPGNSWSRHVHFIGALSIFYSAKDVDLKAIVKRKWIETADKLVEKVNMNDYFQPIDDFHWGSNSDIANAAIILGEAYKLTRNVEYLKAALETVDYLFGKNAIGYSFVTGFGHKTPMFIHHRQSAADGIAKPVPGLLSGGPNSRMQDRAEVEYPENPSPMKSWVDQEPSYASNEICLNWNAPLTYILGFLGQEIMALYSK